MEKKVIYIAGPVTGVKNYWEPFEAAEDLVSGLGHIALTPTRLPKGMTNAQYMRICFAMIDSADIVLFLPRWEDSEGATLEHYYCEYTKKPHVFLKVRDMMSREGNPEGVIRAWLQHDLEEVLKNE